MAVHTPDWVKHAVFYQIFPDRFARSERIRHPRGIRFAPWGSPPEEQGFQGGDLLGIVDKLDYLEELGVNALYLNPIFASASNHRYHTYDYYTVDPLLGGDRALRELLDAAHDRDMRVVLDGVFNHASRGFWAFHHILETGGKSPYLDWFFVNDWPLRPYPHDANTTPNYSAWWGLPALPKLNVANPGVRDVLLDVAAYWIEFGADGWRLDVPEEIADAAFWQEFRRVVKQANPEAYLVGEIWHDAVDWLRGDRFDGVMNYVFSRAALGFFGAETLHTEYQPGGYPLLPIDAMQFAAAVDHNLAIYEPEIVSAQLNLMDSHDTARALWIVDGDESALRLCVLFQMTMPGAPCIYYGDEVGLNGATDPYCRAAFPWHDEPNWNHALLDHYCRAVELRRKHPALQAGSHQTVYAAGEVYGFVRATADETLLALFNTGQAAAKVTVASATWLPDDTLCRAVWGRGEVISRNGKLEGVVVPARGALVLSALPGYV